MEKRLGMIDGGKGPPGEQLPGLREENDEGHPKRPHDRDARPCIDGPEDEPIL
jgi:hypothetical protein